MKLVAIFIVAAASAGMAFAGGPTYRQGQNIFIETGVDPLDRTPTWYAPMMAKPYAPSFEILATRGTQGRYYPYTYSVTLKDMIKWHGHDCEGTVHAANTAKDPKSLAARCGRRCRPGRGSRTRPSRRWRRGWCLRSRGRAT